MSPAPPLPPLENGVRPVGVEEIHDRLNDSREENKQWVRDLLASKPRERKTRLRGMPSTPITRAPVIKDAILDAEWASVINHPLVTRPIPEGFPAEKLPGVFDKRPRAGQYCQETPIEPPVDTTIIDNCEFGEPSGIPASGQAGLNQICRLYNNSSLLIQNCDIYVPSGLNFIPGIEEHFVYGEVNADTTFRGNLPENMGGHPYDYAYRPFAFQQYPPSCLHYEDSMALRLDTCGSIDNSQPPGRAAARLRRRSSTPETSSTRHAST